MIPRIDQPLIDTLQGADNPSLTYRLDYFAKRIDGKIDGKSSVTQAIEKILATERFAYVIYSGQYGVELEALIGKNTNYVVSVLKNKLHNALTADDRVYGISNFEIKEISVDHIYAVFIVNTSYGQVEYNGVIL